MNKHPSFANLVGLPYKEVNCWKLAQMFYKQVLDIELKNYFEEIPTDLSERKNLVFTNVGDFKITTTPKFGDLMLMKILGHESHIGIFLGSGRMLHSTEKNGSNIDRISKWERMITGYYTLGDSND